MLYSSLGERGRWWRLLPGMAVGSTGAGHTVFSACLDADYDPFEFAADKRSDIKLILHKAEGDGVFYLSDFFFHLLEKKEK